MAIYSKGWCKYNFVQDENNYKLLYTARIYTSFKILYTQTHI